MNAWMCLRCGCEHIFADSVLPAEAQEMVSKRALIKCCREPRVEQVEDVERDGHGAIVDCREIARVLN